MMRTLAICGISGVGKSYFANAASAALGARAVSASDLLKAGRSIEMEADVAHDSLRELPLDRNQLHIETGYKVLRDDYTGVLLLDCHVVIDTVTGLETVPSQIFRVLDLETFIFLRADPKTIFDRRSQDAERQRPSRTVDELAEAQEVAHNFAYEIASELSIPFHVVDVGDSLGEPSAKLRSLGVIG